MTCRAYKRSRRKLPLPEIGGHRRIEIESGPIVPGASLHTRQTTCSSRPAGKARVAIHRIDRRRVLLGEHVASADQDEGDIPLALRRGRRAGRLHERRVRRLVVPRAGATSPRMRHMRRDRSTGLSRPSPARLASCTPSVRVHRQRGRCDRVPPTAGACSAFRGATRRPDRASLPGSCLAAMIGRLPSVPRPGGNPKMVGDVSPRRCARRIPDSSRRRSPTRHGDRLRPMVSGL